MGIDILGHICTFFSQCSPLVVGCSGMDMISLEGKTNFFEKRVAEYQKSGVMASLEQQGPKSGQLDFDADF